MCCRDEEQHIWCLWVTELCDIDRELFALEAREWMRKRDQLCTCLAGGTNEAAPCDLVSGVEVARFWHPLTVAGAS